MNSLLSGPVHAWYSLLNRSLLVAQAICQGLPSDLRYLVAKTPPSRNIDERDDTLQLKDVQQQSSMVKSWCGFSLMLTCDLRTSSINELRRFQVPPLDCAVC